MIHLRPTRSVLEIADRLERAGFEAWCVGGALRDALLGGDPLDWDIATQATPEEVMQLFGRRRTIPVGIRFGTVTVLDDAGVAHEVTTFRRDVKTDGRHAEVEFGASLEDDLARRDFTMNAIALRPKTDSLRDPFGGRADIASKTVRAVGDAEKRMREDRLRALRGIRFASRYGFTIEPATLAAIRSSAPHLTRLSAERVQQELVKTMEQVTAPSGAFRLWRDVGAFSSLIPALAQITGVGLRTLDFLSRRAGALTRSQRTSNRVAALWLDVPVPVARQAMTDLRFSKSEINWTCALLAAWRDAGDEMTRGADFDAVSDRQLRMWMARIGRVHSLPYLRLARARWCAVREAGGTAPAPEAVRRLYRRFATLRFATALDIGDLAIGGEELRQAGIRAGPLYAKILHQLLGQVLDDPARNNAAWLTAEAVRLAETGPSSTQ